jgi:hypothetical protein
MGGDEVAMQGEEVAVQGAVVSLRTYSMGQLHCGVEMRDVVEPPRVEGTTEVVVVGINKEVVNKVPEVSVVVQDIKVVTHRNALLPTVAGIPRPARDHTRYRRSPRPTTTPTSKRSVLWVLLRRSTRPLRKC